MKLRSNGYFRGLLKDGQLLMPQLRKMKKACFKPYITNEQFVRYLCEDCSAKKKYSHCYFYEATHLDSFKPQYERIMKDDTIPKPKEFHPLLERLCFGRIEIEVILEAVYNLMKHRGNETNDVEWKKKRNRLEEKIPCSKCNYAKWCNFHNNGIHEVLVQTDIVGLRDDRILIDIKTPREFSDEGYITKSWYYKHIVSQRHKKQALQETRTIKSEKEHKRYDDWQYHIYSKCFDAAKAQPPESLNIPNFHLLLMLCDRKVDFDHLFAVYRYLRQQQTADLQYPDKYQPFVDRLIALKILVGNKETKRHRKWRFDVTESLKIENIKKLKEEEPELFSRALRHFEWFHMLRVDVRFLVTYMSSRKLSYYDVAYEWFLTNNNNLSRTEIEATLGISKTTQIEIEKRLNIRKEWINYQKDTIEPLVLKIKLSKKQKQLPNRYITNKTVIENIFKTQPTTRTNEVLTRVAERNADQQRFVDELKAL